MILILTDDLEPTTDLVIDWLIASQKEFIRISTRDEFRLIKIYKEDCNNSLEAIIEVNNQIINTNDIQSYWYRRSAIGWSVGYNQLDINNKIESALYEFLSVEKKETIRLVDYILGKKAKMNRYYDNELIKLQNLDIANSIGLSTPDILISSEKEEIRTFYNKHNSKIITKTIGDPTSFFDLNLHQFTSLVSKGDIDLVSEESLFQEYIDKAFELRIFYFNDIFYSSAVFSQESEFTSIDLKNIESENPNRIVPYQISLALENQLKSLMQKLNLLSGSIDMIVTKDSHFIFLEVNPIGQFEQVANPCNYPIYKEISSLL